MDEFAPEYTKTEKIRLVFGRYIWIILTLFIIHIWIFTSYARFVDNSACEKFGPLLGAELVLYGLYVGMPMLIGVPCLIYGYLRGKKIITQGQDPLRGEKVWKRRPYVYGWRAHIETVNSSV